MSKLENDVEYLLSTVKDIKDRIKTLEKRRSGKAGEMALWIKEQINERGFISVRLLKKGAKENGYSWQVLQRVRRQMLSNYIEAVFSEGRGWLWRKRSFKLKPLDNSKNTLKHVQLNSRKMDFDID